MDSFVRSSSSRKWSLSEVIFFFLSCSDDDPFGENQILTHMSARTIKSVHNINTNRWSPSIGNQFHKSIYRKWLSRAEQIHYWFNCGPLRLQEVIWKVTLSKSNGFVQYLCFKGGGAKAFTSMKRGGSGLVRCCLLPFEATLHLWPEMNVGARRQQHLAETTGYVCQLFRCLFIARKRVDSILLKCYRST